MTIIEKIRVYHATLAALSALSYMTGELGIIHSWLGYGVAAVIAVRLLWALTGNPHVGLMRFYPSFEGLKFTNFLTHSSVSKSFMLGIALCLIAATASGIALDKGKGIGYAQVEFVAAAHADDDGDDDVKRDERERSDKEKEGFYEEALEEGHELFANLLLLFVGMHVSYLLLFKLPLAKYMLFLNKPHK